MIQIHQLAKLLDPAERTSGACVIAQTAGATHLCLFIRDRELDKFLPGPGFPQKFPGGMEWIGYIRKLAAASTAVEAQLQSPFTSTRVHVTGFHLSQDAIAVLFGDALHADAAECLTPGLRIIGELLVQEVHANRVEIRAQLSQEMVLESRQLAKSLSDAHDQLAAVLDARESLLQEVRKRDTRLQLARMIAGIGVWEFQPATGAVYLAPETTAIYGLPAGEYVGEIETLRESIHAADRARIREEMARAQSGAGDYNVRFRVVWQNGIIRWVEERGMILESGDGVAPAVIGFTMDITQRLMTEEALIRSEKLAAAGRLAASIAHEINNPLEGLVNLVYLARTDTDPASVQELLARAEVELERISSVARTALGFYREGTTATTFDISLAVQQVLELFSKNIRDAEAAIRTEWLAENVEVDGWPGEIKQAFSNLLINALHAGNPSGLIRVRIKRVRNQIQLTVADNGHGITPGHLERIFEPFFSTKKDSGTGLGLWVTKQIIEKHGGSIRVRSSTTSTQRGTVFLLSFPAAGSMEFESSDQSLRYRWLRIGA